MNDENIRVHVSHCCIFHGCKYCDKDCPVSLGEIKQSSCCYQCREDGFEEIPVATDVNGKFKAIDNIYAKSIKFAYGGCHVEGHDGQKYFIKIVSEEFCD